jgi:hypothetical protein
LCEGLGELCVSIGRGGVGLHGGLELRDGLRYFSLLKQELAAFQREGGALPADRGTGKFGGNFALGGRTLAVSF